MRAEENIRILGIPFDGKSSYLRGAAEGPKRLFEELGSSAYNVYSESQTPVLSHEFLKGPELLAVADYESILPGLREWHGEEYDRALYIGGDHSITYPLVQYINKARGPCHILHFDAHGDLYPDYEGDPYSHACPFARIVEDGLALSVTQVGVRTLTPEQVRVADKYNVEIYTMENLGHFSPDWLDAPLYISLDLDVLDPAFAPGVAHREAGGISTRTLIDWLQQVNVPVIGADIVEYNPSRDIGDLTASTVYKLLKELLDVMVRNPA